MEIKQGNMWDVLTNQQFSSQLVDLFLITANATIRKDGCLVMGRGIAYEAKQRRPELPKRAGTLIQKTAIVDNKGHRYYGVLRDLFNDSPIGLFQTKYNYWDMSNIELIESSLHDLATIMEKDGLSNVHLNYPGIGYGHLAQSDVLPLLESILSNYPVTVWQR